MIIKKCLKCDATVEVLKNCTCEYCGLTCCGEKMITLNTNSEDASIEKHLPSILKDGAELVITVNHVMEDEHYIEWIAVETESEVRRFNLKPGDKPEVRVPFVENVKVYSYCNKHGLWMNEN